MATGTTEERLEKLERSTRRYRLVLAGLGTAILACVIWVGLGTAGKVRGFRVGRFTVRELVVEDNKGNIRAALVPTEDAMGLCLYDKKGQRSAWLGVTNAGPKLQLADENDNVRAQLGVNEAGPVLMLADESDNVRAQVGVGTAEQDGKLITFTESSLRLFNAVGTLTWSAP